MRRSNTGTLATLEAVAAFRDPSAAVVSESVVALCSRAGFATAVRGRGVYLAGWRLRRADDTLDVHQEEDSAGGTARRVESAAAALTLAFEALPWSQVRVVVTDVDALCDAAADALASAVISCCQRRPLATVALELQPEWPPEQTTGAGLRALFLGLGPWLTSLSAAYVGDGFPELAVSPQLRRLSVSHCADNERWLSHAVLRAPALEVLHVAHTGRLLLPPRLPSSLVALTVEHATVHDSQSTWEAVRGCARLSKLVVESCSGVGDVSFVGEVPTLETLSLKNSDADVESLVRREALSLCAGLRHLNLSACESLSDAAAVSQLYSLRYLFLYHTAITNSAIDCISHCLALEKLNIGRCVLISDVNGLAPLGSLKELHLWNTSVDDAGIVGLRSCQALEELVLDGCRRVGDVSTLAGLPMLKYLSLLRTDVDEAGIRQLHLCPLLECLSICGTRVGNAPKLWNHESIQEYLLSLF